MRIMCLDIGEKRIGVALSDPLGVIAQGAEVIDVRNFVLSLERILELVNECNVSEIVIGLPKNMDASCGKSSDLAIEYYNSLRSKTDIPITLWDERLSTREAQRTLIEADVSRRKRKCVVDKLAAAIILDGYLRFRQESRCGKGTIDTEWPVL